MFILAQCLTCYSKIMQIENLH